MATTAKARQKAKPARTTHRFTWRTVALSIREQHDYLIDGNTHLELLAPKGTVLPLTDTGYKSHFIDTEQLLSRGGAVAFFTQWLEAEAATPKWRKAEAARRQLDFFALLEPRQPARRRR